MRNILAITITIYLSLGSAVKAQVIKQEKYQINGVVKGIDSGSIRMLSDDGGTVLDSSVIKNGQFSMQGSIGLPERRLFNISPGSWAFKAFVQNAPLTFTIDTTGASHYGHGSNSWAHIWEIKETGSEMADVYERFNDETKQNYYRSLLSNIPSHSIDSVIKVVQETQKAWIENFIRQNPASIVGVYLLYEYYGYFYHTPVAYVDSMLNRFSGLATHSIYYKEMITRVANEKKVEPGNLAPNFNLAKRDKSRFTLSSTKGNYTLLDFWASWCAPCRKAIPEWKKIYANYKQKGLIIVGISNDRTWNDWIRALDEEQMPWLQVIDELPGNTKTASANDLYEITYLPFYVLIDKEGKIILRSGSKDAVITKIKELMP